MLIREMTINDLPNVTKIHMECFGKNFLSTIGPKFVAAYYKRILLNYPNLSFVAVVDNKVIGFILCSDGRVIANNLKNIVQTLSILWHILPRLISMKFLIQVYHKIQTRKSFALHLPYLFIESIASVGNIRNAGVGTLLINKAISMSISKHYKYIYLTTDVDNNQYILDFYTKRSFKLLQEYIQSGSRRMRLLAREIF